MSKTTPNDPRIKIKNRKKICFFIKIHTKAVFSSETIILTLLKLLKPMKTDRKSIVDSGSLDITSGSRLKWPFMPKQGPRSSPVLYCTVLYSTVQYYSSVQYCTVLYKVPCFGTNGHSSRGTDVIKTVHIYNRRPISFIGFRSLSKVKMVVLDEIMTFVWFVIEKVILIFDFLFWSQGHLGTF